MILYMEDIKIPDRASNAGPEPGAQPAWRDLLDDAREYAQKADRTEASYLGFTAAEHNARRIALIDRAIAALQEAKELLCR